MRKFVILFFLAAMPAGLCAAPAGLPKEITGPGCGNAEWSGTVFFRYGDQAWNKRAVYFKNGSRLRIETYGMDGKPENIKMFKDGKFYTFNPETRSGYIFDAADPSVYAHLSLIQVNIGGGKKKEQPDDMEEYRGQACLVVRYDIFKQVNGSLVNMQVREWRRQKDGMTVKIACTAKQPQGDYSEIYELNDVKCRIFSRRGIFDIPSGVVFTDASKAYKDAALRSGKEKGRMGAK